MRNLKRVSLVSLVSVALLGTMALPANAADADSKANQLTVQVVGNGISIAPPLAITSEAIKPGADATFTMEAVTVTDERAVTTPWVATVTLSEFAGQLLENTLVPVSAKYDAALATKLTGAVTFTGDPTALDVSMAPVTAQQATTVSGNNTAAWDATLIVKAPEQALADTYTATLTHSVS